MAFGRCCKSNHFASEILHLPTPRRSLDEYVNLIKVYITLVPSEIVFLLDETGLSGWEERRRKPVLATAETASQPLHDVVDRGTHPQTPLCCISASGMLLTLS
jgi:hypothetical protein